MAERKTRYAVLTYFEKIGGASVGNKARLQWDADGLLESYPYEEIKQVIDYFFRISRNRTWTRFLYGFDDYRNAMMEASADATWRAYNREKLRDWLDE